MRRRDFLQQTSFGLAMIGASGLVLRSDARPTPRSHDAAEAETLFKEPEKMAKLFAEMGRYNEELVKAGIMKGGDGLKPSKYGKRIRFNGTKRSVVDGPFAETKELVAGFWIWEVKSIEEAVEWAKKCPNPMPGEESDLEIRPYYEAADFGEGFTPEEQAREADLRNRIGDV